MFSMVVLNVVSKVVDDECGLVFFFIFFFVLFL